MAEILYLASYPSPYRVDYFDALGKLCDLTVLYSDRKEEQGHRSKDWFVENRGNHKAVQLTRRVAAVEGRCLCLDVIPWLNKKWDHIVLTGYSSPSVMLAMAWLKLRRIPFWLEVDGGIIRADSKRMLLLKKTLVGSADRWLSTGKTTTDFLVHYGAKREKTHEYPFSSLHEADILPAVVPQEEKLCLRRELELEGEKIILSIGQFIHRKGFDILLKAAAQLQPGAHIYIVGGEPTEGYLQLCGELGLENVHFAGFMKKERLLQYYRASDLFVLPTREDIWGLVINEAMAFGLPVITTDRCVAGLELVEEGVSGFIVPVEDDALLAEKMNLALSSDLGAMGAAALEAVRPYTIENMALRHMEIFENRR